MTTQLTTFLELWRDVMDIALVNMKVVEVTINALVQNTFSMAIVIVVYM
jgi:hypothetical protein